MDWPHKKDIFAFGCSNNIAKSRIFEGATKQVTGACSAYEYWWFYQQLFSYKTCMMLFKRNALKGSKYSRYVGKAVAPIATPLILKNNISCGVTQKGFFVEQHLDKEASHKQIKILKQRKEKCCDH